MFIGTVRNATKGKAVLRLEFEAYEPMALTEMEKIVKQSNRKMAGTKSACPSPHRGITGWRSTCHYSRISGPPCCRIRGLPLYY